ncbi:hypothetical protein YC2023_089625 [Brassica napus]
MGISAGWFQTRGIRWLAIGNHVWNTDRWANGNHVQITENAEGSALYEEALIAHEITTFYQSIFTANFGANLLYEPKTLNQVEILLTQEEKYKKCSNLTMSGQSLKVKKFPNNFPNRADALQEEVRNVMSSPSPQVESSPSPGMDSFDLNMNSKYATFNLSQRPMGVKKERETKKI